MADVLAAIASILLAYTVVGLLLVPAYTAVDRALTGRWWWEAGRG